MKKSKKGFNDLVYDSLKENRTFSLTSLFESDDNEKKGDDDLFSTNDESSETESDDAGDDDLFSTNDESSETESGDDTSNPDGTKGDVDQKEIDLHTAYQAIQDLDDILNLRTGEPYGISNNKKRRRRDTIHGITNENYVKKINISKFLILEKDESSDFVSDMKKAVEKNDDLIKTINKQKAELEAGSDISVEKEVRIAIDKLIHFREKVDIIDLIEELFIDKIRLIAPAEDIEKNIEDFIELYRDEVHKNRAKIDIPGSKHYNDEEVYLDKGGDYNGAAGARSQG